MKQEEKRKETIYALTIDDHRCQAYLNVFATEGEATERFKEFLDEYWDSDDPEHKGKDANENTYQDCLEQGCFDNWQDSLRIEPVELERPRSQNPILDAVHQMKEDGATSKEIREKPKAALFSFAGIQHPASGIEEPAEDKKASDQPAGQAESQCNPGNPMRTVFLQAIQESDDSFFCIQQETSVFPAPRCRTLNPTGIQKGESIMKIITSLENEIAMLLGFDPEEQDALNDSASGDVFWEEGEDEHANGNH